MAIAVATAAQLLALPAVQEIAWNTNNPQGSNAGPGDSGHHAR